MILDKYGYNTEDINIYLSVNRYVFCSLVLLFTSDYNKYYDPNTFPCNNCLIHTNKLLECNEEFNSIIKNYLDEMNYRLSKI